MKYFLNKGRGDCTEQGVVLTGHKVAPLSSEILLVVECECVMTLYLGEESSPWGSCSSLGI